MQSLSLKRAIRSISLQFMLAAGFLFACGGTPGADEPPPDVTCECPSPPTLDSSTVNHVPFLYSFQPGLRGGQGMYCNDRDIAIGGGCTYHGTDPRMSIMYSGDINVPEYPHSWMCGFHNLTQQWQDVVTTAICLTPEAKSSSPQGCDCIEFEPVADRIARIAQSKSFQGYSTNELTVECLDGGILLTGGCANQGPGVGALHDMTLSRSGFATAEATTWSCGWNTPVQTDGELMLATAYCLQPPTYGPDPLEGRIARVIESQTVPANGYASFTASCAPGDFLLAGSCMLDSADPVSHQAIMYHHGFDAEDSNTWRCAWNNPTALALPATAMATCVTKPAQ